MPRTWLPFERVPDEQVRERGYPLALGERVWRNNLYQVYERALTEDESEPAQQWVHLSIKRHDRNPVRDWRDLQRIKNEIVGPEAEGVELYPAESRLVDTSNQYHLWCVKGGRFPFGWHTRVVSDLSEFGAKQRPWPTNERPADCLDKETATKLVSTYLTNIRKGESTHG